MPEYSFTVTEHDPGRPWIVVSHERKTVELDDRVPLIQWARARWPEPRWTIELDPWQLSPRRE